MGTTPSSPSDGGAPPARGGQAREQLSIPPPQYGGGGPGPYPTPEWFQSQFLAGVRHDVFMQPGFAPAFNGMPAPRVESAVTVRNDVNVKKSSVRVVEDIAARSTCPPGHHILYLEFDFDANTPACISIHTAVREVLPHMDPRVAALSIVDRLSPLHRDALRPRRYLFPRGLGQRFSQALSDGYGVVPSGGVAVAGVRGRDCVDTARYSEVELTNAPRGGDGIPGPSATWVPTGAPPLSVASSEATMHAYAVLPPHAYPVVIVIESLPDGAHTSADASLQLTYVTLLFSAGPEHAGESATAPAPGTAVTSHVTAKVLKQKIQVRGQTYELREIYGIDSSSEKRSGGEGATSAAGEDGGAAGSAMSDVLSSGSECVICLTEKRDTTVLPCRHMCLCNDCAQQLRFASNRCPVCRTQVQSLLQIKIESSPGAAAGGSGPRAEADNTV